MYKKIIVIILSFFFVLSCAKENPNNPGDVSGGGDTGGNAGSGNGGNTGDGGDGGQTQPSLAKYAGAWKQDFRVHVFGENYYIIKMGSSSGGQQVVFITNIQYSSADNGFKVYYKAPQKYLDAVVSFSSDNLDNIKGEEYNYFASKIQSISYDITKLPKGTGIDPQYAGTYRCGKYRSIKIDTDGSIESFYENTSEFKMPAEQITKNSEGGYEAYLYKTTYEQTKDVVLEIIELKFSDSSHCKFRFECWFTSGSPLSKGNGSLVDYIKQQ